MVDLRNTYSPMMLWGTFSHGFKAATFWDEHFRLNRAFTDHHLSVAKGKVDSGGSEQSYKSAVNANAYALHDFSKFLAAVPVYYEKQGEIKRVDSWKQIRSEHLIRYRNWAFKNIRAGDGKKSILSTKRTVNVRVRAIYKFYEWAQEDACLVDEIIGWKDCPIRSALLLRREAGGRLFSKEELLYPACYRQVGSKSGAGSGKYWATDDDIHQLEDYFWKNCLPEVAERNVVILKIVQYMGWRPGSVTSLTIDMFTTSAADIANRSKQDVFYITPPVQKFQHDYSFEMPFPILDMTR